jgi:1A family penicillin-binding protein
VARRHKSLLNDKLAPKLAKKYLFKAGKVLDFVGRPLYFLLSYIAIALLFIAYITGRNARTFLTTLFTRIIGFFRNLYPILLKTLKFLQRRKDKLNLKQKLIKQIKFINKKASSISSAYKKGVYLWEVSITKTWKKLFQSAEKQFRATKKALVKISPPKVETKKIFAFQEKIKTYLSLTLLKLKLILLRIRFPKIRLKLPRPKIGLIYLALFIISLISATTLYTVYLFYDLPSPEDLINREIEVSTKIHDRNGVLLYKIYKDKNRSIVTLDDVPDYVRLATLAAEDAEFYNHPGFSIKGIIRSVIKNVAEGQLSGGSTITQQLVKNALLSPEKSITRKLREIILSVQTEMTFSKDQILEMYLNEVSYGGTAYGIQEASQLYFGKDVDELTVGEAALLAGLPKSPTKYSPFGANPELAMARQKEVVNLMRINGYITREQEEKVLAEKINFAPNEIDIKAPHFVMYVRSVLEEAYGKEVVEKGGLEVVTTLDYDIQKLAEEVVREEVEKLKSLNVTNGAVVVLKPSTGEVLAMVGSKNYFDFGNDGNVNVATSLRQPGSSIKVINYAYALSNGYTPATIIQDVPTSFLVQGQPTYTPSNYDGSFRGNLTLRSALAESRNVPAVRVLASYGVKNMIDMGQKMGITTWTNPSDYGLSLTLGGGDIKLVDLARVYSTVANYGKRPDLISIKKVTNYKGSVLDQDECLNDEVPSTKLTLQLTKEARASEVLAKDCKQEQVIDARVAYLLTDILKDNQARTPSFGSISELVIPGHKEVAVKTGTSNNLRDNLTIGYNQDYLVAVWVGNNDNSPMSRIASGVTGASPIFNKIMSALLADKSNHDWVIPDGLTKIAICADTGTLACEGCLVKYEWFLKENIPTQKCEPKDKNEEEEEPQKNDIKEKIINRIPIPRRYAPN